MLSISEVNICLQNNIEFEFEFPEYYPNFPVKRNSYYNEQSIENNYKFIQEFCNVGLESDATFPDGLGWTTFSYPFANKSRIENLAKFASLFYCVDDNFEHDNGMGARNINKSKKLADIVCQIIDNIDDIRKIPIYELQTWKPLMFSLYVCMLEIKSRTGATFWKFFSSSLKGYLQSCVKECEIAEQIWDITERELLEFRLINSCGKPWIILLQYANGYELTDEEMNNEFLQNVIKYAILSLIMCNDFYSFANEMKECNGMLEKCKNMIAVLMKSQSLTLQEAVNKTRTILINIDKSYAKSLEKLMETQPSENIKQFCSGIDYMIGGNWIVHLGSKRYHGLNYNGCIPSCGTFKYSQNKMIIIQTVGKENKFEKFNKYFVNKI